MIRLLPLLLLACASNKALDSQTTPATSAGTTSAGSPFTSTWSTTSSATVPPGAPEIGTPSGPGTFPTDTATANWDECDWALHVAGYLDSINTTPGRTLFCHSSNAVNWTFVDADPISCATHLDHALDIFPSWGC